MIEYMKNIGMIGYQDYTFGKIVGYARDNPRVKYFMFREPRIIVADRIDKRGIDVSVPMGEVTDDDWRRCCSIREMSVINKDTSILDFGCGGGGFVSLMNDCYCVGYDIGYDTKYTESKYDIITLFHVFEHLADPVGEIEFLKHLLNPGGRFVIEIPSADDFLLHCKAFRDFTLWSEHLVLYSAQAMQKMLEFMSLEVTDLRYIQRYNFNNHYGWIKDGKPGGHTRYNFDSDICNNYESMLVSSGQTDTLWIVAQ
jgi:hypothetical protein